MRRRQIAAKTAFLSRMSHDIRTPLNGSSGFLRSTTDKITSTEHEQKRPEKQVNLAGVKVLLAEDNELNREIAKFFWRMKR